jgi:hypothetical protein
VRALTNYSIAAIALDRLHAVTKPVEYRKKDSKKSFVVSTSICWSISIVMGILMMILRVDGDRCTFLKIHPTLTMTFSIVGKILPYAVVIGSYAVIFWTIRKVRFNVN